MKCAVADVPEWIGKLVPTPNPLGGPDVLWGIEECIFLKNNFQNSMDFYYDIKVDILRHILKTREHGCVIDCGAHIGDGVIHWQLH